MAGRDIFEELMEGMKYLAEHRQSMKEGTEVDSRSEPVDGEGVEDTKPTNL